MNIPRFCVIRRKQPGAEEDLTMHSWIRLLRKASLMTVSAGSLALGVTEKKGPEKLWLKGDTKWRKIYKILGWSIKNKNKAHN